MADLPISAFPPVISSELTDELVINRGGVNFKQTNQNIKDLIGGGEDATFGEMTFQDNSLETVIVVQGTPVKVATTAYIPGQLLGFSHANGTITLDDDINGTFSVQVKTTSSFNLASGSMSGYIALNGSILPGSKVTIDFSGVSPSFTHINCQAEVPLVQGDTLEVHISNDTGTENITVQDLQFIVQSAGGGASSGTVTPETILFAGYTSPVSTTDPTFTAPIVILYSVKAEGTWTKVVGMSQINQSGDLSFVDDTVTINSDGQYTISISSVFEVDTPGSGDRVSMFTLGVNVDDTDKVLGDLPPQVSSSETDASNWTNISSSGTLPFLTNDTIKIFYSQVNESGGNVNDTNIAMMRIYVVKVVIPGSAGDTTLQDAWESQANGSIALNDGVKVFAVTEADGTTEVLRAHPTESVTLRGTNLFPPTIHGLGGNASIQRYIDTRNTTIGSSSSLLFEATPLACGPSFFTTLSVNIISENKSAGFEKTRIFMSNRRNGVTHTLLDMNPTAQTIIFGDPIVPLSLTTAEIASHPKSAGMLVRNQNTERLEYYDNLAESMKALAYLDDIIPTESGRNTLVVNSTVDCNITGGPYFYNYIKVGNIVDLTFDIAFTTTTDEPAITVALPFTPNFTDFVQAYASTEVILQPAVGNLGDNAQVVSTNSTLSQISFVMGSDALADYRLRATVKYQIQ